IVVGYSPPSGDCNRTNIGSEGAFRRIANLMLATADHDRKFRPSAGSLNARRTQLSLSDFHLRRTQAYATFSRESAHALAELRDSPRGVEKASQTSLTERRPFLDARIFMSAVQFGGCAFARRNAEFG